MSKAPVPCAERGCLGYAFKAGRCESHQRGAFLGTFRKERLPADWTQRRRLVLSRDKGLCVVCGDDATDVDHIVPITDDHSLKNLQSLCNDCHRTKTAWEGNWAQGKGLDKGPDWVRRGRTDLAPTTPESLYGKPF